MPLILVVCTANLFRSPIAAACIERKLHVAGLADSWNVASAGTWTYTGLPAHPEALMAAAALGLDLSAHRTREVNSALLTAADLIIVMEQGQKEALECEFPNCRGKIALLGELAGERDPDIPDPSKTEFNESDAIARMIAACIERVFTELLRKAEISRINRRDQRSITAEVPPLLT
jgi:protein-tyrosine phosphatase